jgi:hypothetical protein
MLQLQRDVIVAPSFLYLLCTLGRYSSVGSLYAFLHNEYSVVIVFFQLLSLLMYVLVGKLSGFFPEEPENYVATVVVNAILIAWTIVSLLYLKKYRARPLGDADRIPFLDHVKRSLLVWGVFAALYIAGVLLLYFSTRATIERGDLLVALFPCFLYSFTYLGMARLVIGSLLCFCSLVWKARDDYDREYIALRQMSETMGWAGASSDEAFLQAEILGHEHTVEFNGHDGYGDGGDEDDGSPQVAVIASDASGASVEAVHVDTSDVVHAVAVPA